MSYEIFNRYVEVDNLLRKRCTGSREELADKLGVSVRSLYRYKETLEKFGAEISFDNEKQSYYYVSQPIGLFSNELVV